MRADDSRHHLLLIVSFLLYYYSFDCHVVFGVEILSKSKLDKCEKVSESGDLNCTKKIVLNMAVPSGSTGGEASVVAELAEVEEVNSTRKMQTLRIPPVITINKSAAYALYEITYLRDVPFKPQELYVKTRKCEPDAGENVVQICERLRDEEGHIIESTQPICCPCGSERRAPSSCGNFFDKMIKGKANTAHCVRFPGDWFHIFGIGQRSMGFSVRIEVKTETKVSEVFVGPENRTVLSNDTFLKVNLIGDFAGYTNIPSFEDCYLVIPRQGGPGQPQDLGRNYSMWMLLERVYFTLDGLECNKIGVGYEAFNGQSDFCSSPLWSCLHNQLWNFWEADQNRISRHQPPLYCVEGKFERINQHPNAGTHSFSIGVTEVLNTNLLIELAADDIEYVYQRSPGKILSATIPTFEALTQVGTATVTAENIGEVEASYSLTFDCSSRVALMEEQFFILKPKEVTTRSFKLYPTSDQAAKYICSAILKDSDFNEVDRAECQFVTTATVIDIGSITPFQEPKTGMNGFFGSIESIWSKLWTGLADFVTGRVCRNKCSGMFDFSCHIQYICMSWIVFFALLLAIFPAVLVILWLLHQKGLFDPLYDWWEDHFFSDDMHDRNHGRRHRIKDDWPHVHHHKHHSNRLEHHRQAGHGWRRGTHNHGHHHHPDRVTDFHHYLHHVDKDRHKHRRPQRSSVMLEDANIGHPHHRHRKDRETIEELYRMQKHGEEKHRKILDYSHYKMHLKRRE